MLRLVHYGNAMPISLAVDESSEFQPGQLAELTVSGNRVVATVSNGTAPIGVIDDIRIRAFTSVAWNEVVIAPATGVISGGKLVTPIDISKELKNPNIVQSSFMSTVDLVLNPINGIITFPAGTELNLDLTGSGTPNAIKAVVNYTYNISNIPGDDSTAGSGRITIWYNRMFLQTDQYETNQQYPVRANLYCSEKGLWTTRKPSAYHPAIGMVTAPPTTLAPLLEIMTY